MNKNDILDYVMNTPGNTNRAVLSGMLDGLESGSGSDVKVLEVRFTEKSDNVYTCDVDQIVLREEYEAGTIIRGKIHTGGDYFYVTEEGIGGTDNGIVFSGNTVFTDSYEGIYDFDAYFLYAPNKTTNDYTLKHRLI